MSEEHRPVTGPAGGTPPRSAAARPSRYDAHAEAPDHDLRGVLAIAPFRRLWLSLGLSSFGDWLGLLATTALARNLGGESSYAAANFAVAGVLILRLAPAIVFGPFAGALADRFDRKVTMVVGDVLRAGLFVSIPLVGTLWWLFVATVLIEIVGLFWMPAKDATVPNLVPRRRLEAANQISLATTYGSAPFAALLFAGLALLSGVVDEVLTFLGGPIDLALYANAATYLVAASVIWRLDMPRRAQVGDSSMAPPSVWRTIGEGWAFVGTTPLVRGLVIGMLGAFGAGGFVIGVAPSFVRDLGAGEPGYGVLFAAVFAGLAGGMWVGPRLLADLPRWRLFAGSIVVAGGFLALVALIPNIVLAAIFTALLGSAAGVAWVTGYTMLGLEVADELRGRTFGFVQSAARVVLVAVMAFAPALAAVIGTNSIRFTPTVSLDYNGAALTLLVASVLAVAIGLVSYRQMHDGTEVGLREDLVRAWTRRHVAQPAGAAHGTGGFLLALEGGDGAGKSTQAQRLREWLADEVGHEVVLTREPGATALGTRLRDALLHGGEVDPRAEALMFAADRAQHVAQVVRPALERGAVVITDRFTDSSIAYQGAGRDLDADEVAQLSRWATDGLVPDLTVLLDVDPGAGRRRVGERGGTDRLEGEALDFHSRVRTGFVDLARRDRRRYLVLDAGEPAEVVQRQIRERLVPVLPESPTARADREADEARRARREAEEREREEVESERRAATLEQARVDAERRRAEEAEQRRVEAERARAEAERRRAEEAEQRRQEAERRRAETTRRRAEDAERRRVDAEQRRVEAEQRAAERRAEQAARREREAAEARRVEAEKAHARAERAAAERQRREDEVAAHAEEARRLAGGDDRTETASLPVVGPPSTAPIDLRDEVFRMGREPGRGDDDRSGGR